MDPIIILQFGSFSFPIMPSFVGIFVQLLLIVGIFLLLRGGGKLRTLFELFFEKMYVFFEDILGIEEKRWIKLTIVTVFFVVFLANIIGWLGDILAQGIGVIGTSFASFSSDRNGTFAMAVGLVVLSIVVQAMHLGAGKFLHEYVPITGKKYLTVERESMSPLLFYPIWTLAKVFDLVVSFFIAFLDIIGIFAKMISLSFRLYGNMIAGTMLLVLLTEAAKALTASTIGIQFPLIIPLILFVQGLLVVVIQAFVVALLSSIFIRVAKS